MRQGGLLVGGGVGVLFVHCIALCSYLHPVIWTKRRSGGHCRGLRCGLFRYGFAGRLRCLSYNIDTFKFYLVSVCIH